MGRSTQRSVLRVLAFLGAALSLLLIDAGAGRSAGPGDGKTARPAGAKDKGEIDKKGGAPSGKEGQGGVPLPPVKPRR